MRHFVLYILFCLFTIAGSGEIVGANVSSNVQTEQCLYPKSKTPRIFFLTQKQIVTNKSLFVQNSFHPIVYLPNSTFFDDKNLSYTLSKSRFSQFFKMKLLPNSADDDDLPSSEKA